jgi:hypothetical protein
VTRPERGILLPRGGFALRRFGVSPERSLATSAFFGIYLEKGGRLGLKCLLLSYFRVGDNSTVTCDLPGTLLCTDQNPARAKAS